MRLPHAPQHGHLPWSQLPDGQSSLVDEPMERVRQVPLSLMKCPGKKPALMHGVNQNTPLLLPSATESDSKVLPGTEEPLLTASAGAPGGWRWHGPGALESWHWAQALLRFPVELPEPSVPSLQATVTSPGGVAARVTGAHAHGSLRARSPQPPTGWRWVLIQTQ